ncbi:MAG: hypothetical protein EBR92_10375, partial [Alphaproteobacteria bacterium]|nr:hypothetical protein [Alphaproteobacteria bacterium]
GSHVVINPGDIIVGDGNGVVVVPAVAADAVIEMAEEIVRKEHILLANLNNLSMDERAEARAERMAHVRWLREQGQSW